MNQNGNGIHTVENENAISDYLDSLRDLEMRGYESGVRKARNVLFVTAGLVFVGQLLSIAISDLKVTSVLMGMAFIESAIFVGLGLWTKKKPHTAIVIGLIMFIGLWILTIADSGFRGAISGIIVRVIIISYLISALKPAKSWEEAKRNM